MIYLKSGFRTHHSTEMVINVKVTNDHLLASDSRFISVLALLDLSAVFNTVAHNTLQRLEPAVTITGTVLQLFES